MQFLNATNTFEGVVELNATPTAASHAVNKSWVEGAAIMGIHADSQVHAETVVVNGEKQLKIKSLAITDVQVDSASASLAAWVTANYANGNEVQEGDMIILTGTASARPETYIHNGGNAGTSADFTEITGSDVEASEIRGFLSGGYGISYNSSTGEIAVTNADIRGLFSGDGVVAYDSSNGAFSFAGDSDDVSEGSTNLYYTDTRSRNALSVSGAGLSYDAATGVISIAVGTDDITEETALFYTDARSRAALSAATVAGPDVQLLSYSSSTGALSVPLSGVFNQLSAGQGLSFDGGGEYSLDANTDDIQELAGATNLFFTDARAAAAITVGSGLAKTGGQISLSADTDLVGEGSSNLYFTTQRAQNSIQADPASHNMVTYANGDILVSKNDFRKVFSAQNLSANTWLTLNHALAEQLVHVSCYDSSGNLVQLDVQLVDANNCKIRSVIAVTGADVVVSI